MSWRVQIDDDIYKDNNHSPFITYGDNGITYLQMQSPVDGSIWRAYLDSTGAWVTNRLIVTGNPVGLLLALTYTV